MKKQPNSTGSLSACHHFDNPIVYATPDFLTFLPLMALCPSVQMLTIIPSAFLSLMDYFSN